jgi:hypothetical protein
MGDPDGIRYSAALDPAMMLPRSTYAFKGPLNFADSTSAYPRGGRVPYSEYMAGARPSGATRSRAGYKKSAPKKRTYKAKTTRLKPGLSVKDYGQARLKRGSKFTLANYGETFSKGTARQKANRKKYGYTGRGLYGAKFLSRIGRAVTSPSFIKGVKRGVGYGADALTALAYIDPELAPFAAGAQGASAYMGRGSYVTASHGVNDLIAGGASSVPRMLSVPDETGSLIVSHTERVADIIAPADDKFHVQSFSVQAGLESTFPWLHQLAACYEEYEVLQCVFQYKGHEIVGMQNTLDLQGQVIGATKYNVKSPAFTDRHQMQAYPHSASCSLNGTLQSGVEADPRKIASGDSHRYIRTGGLLTTEDLVDYDHARFELAVNNTPTDLFNKEVGQLFVFYTVKLSKPRLFAGRGQAISSYNQIAKTTSTTFPWGDATGTGASQALVASRNSLAMKYVPTSGSPQWNFPAHANGRYKVQAFVAGGAMDSGETDFGVVNLFGEVTLCSIYPSDNTTRRNLEDADTESYYEMEVLVRPQVGNSPNGFKFNALSMAQSGDSVSASSITIIEVNDFEAGSGFPEYKGIVDGTYKPVLAA